MFDRTMTRATLTICIPADVWIDRVSRSHPETELTILSAFPADDSGWASSKSAGRTSRR
jgi:hypothetical protein